MKTLFLKPSCFKSPVLLRVAIGGLALVGDLSSNRIQAATFIGGNYGGADLVVNNGDVLSGSFTNVGSFTVNSGVTVFVQSGTALSISAQTINISGWLNGNGAGFAGGVTGLAPSANGVAGGGTGGGAGGAFGNGVHASGGAGAGYGTVGGNSGSYFGYSPLPAAGGVAYGSNNSGPVFLGSGGGSAGNHYGGGGYGGNGGAGGGAITLVAPTILIPSTGLVSVDGGNGLVGSVAAYNTSGGGGGSGGGLLLSGGLSLDGTLSAQGGAGASFNGPITPQWGQGGGGGAGGRIQLFGTAFIDTGFEFLLSGGSAGLSTSSTTTFAQSGGTGTFFSGATLVPEPGSSLLLGLGLSLVCFGRRMPAQASQRRNTA